jgi:hypothetical protein
MARRFLAISADFLGSAKGSGVGGSPRGSSGLALTEKRVTGDIPAIDAWCPRNPVACRVDRANVAIMKASKVITLLGLLLAAQWLAACSGTGGGPATDDSAASAPRKIHASGECSSMH